MDLKKIERKLRMKHKVVKGSLHRGDNNKLLCRIHTVDIDGKIVRRRDSRGRFLPCITVCTSDIHQVKFAPEVAHELRLRRRNDKAA